jgi:hypothetical protein
MQGEPDRIITRDEREFQGHNESSLSDVQRLG